MTTETKLTVIDGETLMDLKLPPTKFCVETLLPQGICMLGGAPKIGKSWMVLDLCIRIAKGDSIWNLPTKQGTTLYLCLEDPLRRVQERLNMITDDVPPNAYFAISAGTLADGLCEQIRKFVAEHPDTVLVAIDTFQIVRTGKSVTSKGLKQMMNRWHYALEEHGVRFENHRSNGHRFVEVCYSPAGDESAVSDGNLPCGETCVPFVTCDPVSDFQAI